MRLLKILVSTILVLLPFGELLRFSIGNDIYIKPLDIGVILLFAWVIILYIKNKKWRTSLKPYYFFFPLIGLISLLLNSIWLQPKELMVSFLYLIRWVGYLSIFFAIIQFDDTFKNKIKKFLIADGIVVLVIGFFQFFLYPSLRNLFYLGWDEHLYRMFSSFLDPNFAGTFFVLYFIFLLGLFFHNRKNRSKKYTFLLTGLLVVTLIAVFLTFSRSAFLMLIASGITFFLLLQKKKFIFILLGVIIAFMIIISPFFYIENINLFRVRSSIARLQTAESALKIIHDHAFIGVGFDSYRYAQIRYHIHSAPSKFPDHANSGVDMSLLFIFATTGIVGLGVYCYLWLRLLRQAKQKIKEKNNMFAIVALSSSIGLFVNALFINSLFYPAIMLWMWLIFGLLQSKKEI